MNIKVTTQVPNNAEGRTGELRLVMRGRGAYLYIRGPNQWFSLDLSPTAHFNTAKRLARGDEQRNIQKVADTTWDGGDGEHESILNPGGGKIDKSAGPDQPL